MVLNTRALMNILAEITDDQNMRITVTHSGRGAAVCGAACFIGGLVAGPVGLAIGGTLGGLKAYHMSQGQFKSVRQVLLHEMTDRQREKLRENIMAVAADFEITDLAILLPMILNSPSLKRSVLKAVTSFVTNELRMQIQD